MAGIAGGAAGAVGLIKLAADAETLETQLKTLAGGAENAKALIAELKAFGAATPFEFTGLAQLQKIDDFLAALATESEANDVE